MDLTVWQKAMSLVVEIYELTSSLPDDERFGLTSQMRRAAVSVPSNIAEGFERGGDREFLQFLAIAKGSCGEVRAQLYVALDQDYLSEGQFNMLRDHATEISQLLSGLMKYLRQSELRGSKLK